MIADLLSVLSVTLCPAVIFLGLFVCVFSLDYYGMQLASELLPVYCPHPGPGIITDITRLCTVGPKVSYIYQSQCKLIFWPSPDVRRTDVELG